MSAIIFNHLRRWGWLWLLIGMANIFMGSALVCGARGFSWGIYINVLLWIGAMQLSLDFQKGIGRTLLALPLTARQIGRSWWLLSIGLPVLFLAATTLLGLAGLSVWKGQPFPVAEFAIYIVHVIAFLGVLFAAIIATPRLPTTGLGWLRYIIFGGLLIALMVMNPIKNVWPCVLVYLASIGVTALSWLRAEQNVLWRATFKPGAQAANQKPGRSEVPSGFGGMGYLWLMFAQRLGWMTLAFAGWLVVTQVMFHGSNNSVKTPQQFLQATMPSIISFGYFGLIMIWLMPLLMHLRHLRALPISAAVLAATIILLPCVPIFLVGFAATLVAGDGINGLNGTLVYAAVMSLGTTLTLRIGIRYGFMLSLPLMMLVMVANGQLLKFSASIALIVSIIALALIAFAFEATRRLLRSNNKAYQTSNMMPAGWNMNGGR
jgi:hypothetical protein